jgi:N-acetylmuramoyl-L-alanine amidase
MDTYSIVLLAICTWREAQNQLPVAWLGVIWSILNRAAVAAWWNGHKADDIPAVILMPYQFSSFNSADSNATKLPKLTDPVFFKILAMAQGPGPDPTGGATHYYSTDIAAPAWAAEMTFTIQLGAFRFYK